MLTWIKYTSAKTDLFGISRDLQFGVCKRDELCASSYMTRDKEQLWREEKEVRRDVLSRVYGFSLGGSLPGKNRSHSSSCGLIYHHKVWEIPLLVSQLYLTEVTYLFNFDCAGSSLCTINFLQLQSVGATL